MSEVVDNDFPPQVRAALLDEIRTHLPAFLHRGASEQHDPVGDVRELLNLEPGDLQRVVAVHQCLDEAVTAFGAELERGLRQPLTSSLRPPETSQSVRGPVDWAATIARRSLEAGNRSQFVVRSARRVFDTPENRALAWLLERLHTSAQVALRELGDDALDSPGEPAAGWADRIRRLSAQVRVAQRTAWLRRVEPEPPARATIKRLKASRSSFYAVSVAAAVEAVLELSNPSEQALADVLCRRYFEPARTWLIFEVYVALRLARAFAQASGKPRKARLLAGGSRAPFARYAYPDGSEVALIYQGWPPGLGRSLRREASARHELTATASRPDIFIVRSGPVPDAAVLELKASYRSGYLGNGLSQLLGYLAERPEAWKKKPAGWLVAPASAAFSDRPAAETEDLWIVSAERVADAAVARFAPAAA